MSASFPDQFPDCADLLFFVIRCNVVHESAADTLRKQIEPDTVMAEQFVLPCLTAEGKCKSPVVNQAGSPELLDCSAYYIFIEALFRKAVAKLPLAAVTVGQQPEGVLTCASARTGQF